MSFMIAIKKEDGFLLATDSNHGMFLSEIESVNDYSEDNGRINICQNGVVYLSSYINLTDLLKANEDVFDFENNLSYEDTIVIANRIAKLLNDNDLIPDGEYELNEILLICYSDKLYSIRNNFAVFTSNSYFAVGMHNRVHDEKYKKMYKDGECEKLLKEFVLDVIENRLRICMPIEVFDSTKGIVEVYDKENML